MDDIGGLLAENGNARFADFEVTRRDRRTTRNAGKMASFDIKNFIIFVKKMREYLRKIRM